MDVSGLDQDWTGIIDTYFVENRSWSQSIGWQSTEKLWAPFSGHTAEYYASLSDVTHCLSGAYNCKSPGKRCRDECRFRVQEACVLILDEHLCEMLTPNDKWMVSIVGFHGLLGSSTYTFFHLHVARPGKDATAKAAPWLSPCPS